MSAPVPEALPVEAAGLFASNDFVAERNTIARALRAAGRGEEADAVSKLRKPPKLVAATNRAARALPLQAQAAAAAAEKLAEAQAAGNRRASGEAVGRLGKAVEKLSARVVESEGGDRAAIAQLIRAALTSAPARRRLVDGQLTETPEPSGFEALAGLTIALRPAPVAESPTGGKARERADARRVKLEQELSEAKDGLRAAEDDLDDAEKAEVIAQRAREAAERRVEASRARVESLRRRTS